MKRSLFALLLLLLCASSSWAATYYIKPDGNNSSACTSEATACATWAGVVAKSPAAGSDVYFKCGGTWTGTDVKTMSWSGTSTSSAVITAFADGGGGTVTATTLAAHGWSNDDSIVIEGTKDYDGTYTISGASGSSFSFTATFVPRAPAGYGGLLGFAHKGLNRAIVGAYYLEGATETIGVQGAKPIIDAQYITGIDYNRGAFESNSQHYVTFDNLDIRNQWRRGISIDYSNYATVSNVSFSELLCTGITYLHSSYGGLFENNDIYHAARDQPENPGYSDWSAGFAANGYASYYVFRGNMIRQAYGEGYIHDMLSSNGLIEYNTFYGNGLIVGPYLCDSRRATVRYNLIYGLGTSPQEGISLAFEGRGNSSYKGDFDIYGNFIANTSNGFLAWGGISGHAQYNYPLTNVNIYHNTIVGSTTTVMDLDQWWANLNVKDNIFAAFGGLAAARINLNSYGISTGIVFDYNQWSSQPADTDARGAHDTNSAADLIKTTGWTNLNPASLTVTDFKLGSENENGVNLSLYDYWGTATGTSVGAHNFTGAGPDPPGDSDLPAGVDHSWNFNGDYADDVGSTDYSANGTVAAANGHAGGTDTARAWAESSSNYLSIADGTAPEPTGSFSYAMWVKLGTTFSGGNDHFLFGKPGQWRVSYHYYSPAYTLKFITYTSGAWQREYVVSGTPILDSGDWHHIAVTYDAATKVSRLYLDGSEQGSASGWGDGVIPAGTNAMRVGYDGSLLPTAMTVDDAAMWVGQVLTAQEVGTVYNLPEDFAQELTPNLALNSFGTTPIQINAGTAVSFAWTHTGSPTVCKLYPYNDATEVTVTCGDGVAEYTYNGDPGTYSAKLCLDPAGANVCSTMTDIVTIKDLDISVYPNTWTVCASGCDSTGTISKCGGSTGFQAGDTIAFGTGATGVDISACTAQGSVRFAGPLAGTITGGGQSVLSWPEWLGPSTLVGLTGVQGVPLVIRAEDFGD